MKALLYIFLAAASLFCEQVRAQVKPADTTSQVIVSADTVRTSADTVKAKKDTVPYHDPRKATLRSALIPGWGQAYNREYWKIPIVYGAIGVPVGFFIYNNTWYKRTKKAFEIMITNDTANFSRIHPKLKDLDADGLRYYRNEFRRDRDYSILYTLVAWGLNVADATVFAHLKQFDVSEDLSLKVKPVFSPVDKTQGVSLVFSFKNPRPRSFVIQ